MSAKSATGLSAQSVKKWVIDSDVENQLRSYALLKRLNDESLSPGSVELYLKCANLTAIGWGKQKPFYDCPSLLQVDLSGCHKLKSIPELAFGMCQHLVSVIFGEHSSSTHLGGGAFGDCYALTSITLPDKLEVIEYAAFNICTSLERVVFNKNLKTIDDAAFAGCPKLEDVQLASSSTSFGRIPFNDCDRLIELADAAGFPSNTFGPPVEGVRHNLGVGVVPYLIGRFERSERKRYVLLAQMRFKNAVHASSGTEEEKVASAKKHHPQCPTHPASPARPNATRRGCWDYAPAVTRRGSATGSAKSTAGRNTRSRAKKHASARSWTTARTRCSSASCYPWR